MIRRQGNQRGIRQPVGAAIPDMRDTDPIILKSHANHGRPHAGQITVRTGTAINAPVSQPYRLY